MAPIFDGSKLYIILSALQPQGTDAITLYPDPVPITGGPRPDELKVLGRETRAQPKWRITPVSPDSNTYTITLAGEDEYHFTLAGSLLWLYKTGDATAFSIEPAGNEKYHFHLPDENDVLRLENPDSQVKIAEQDGSDNENWSIVEWKHPI